MRSKMWVRATSTAVGAGLVFSTLVLGPAASAGVSEKQGPFPTAEECDIMNLRARKLQNGSYYSYVGDCYAYRPLNVFKGWYFNTTKR